MLAYRISETIKENVTDYYKAFQTCNHPHNLGDLTPFLLMMLKMIYIALKDLESSLAHRLTSWHKYETLVSSFSSIQDDDTREMYSYLIQAALFSEKGISTAELKNQFNKSYYSVKKLLDKIPEDLLMVRKDGKSKYYQINLSILDDMLLSNATQNNSADN